MILNNVGESKTLANLDGVICIDIWEGSEGPSQHWLDTIDQHIDFKQFSSIIVANYELALDSANDLCQYNTLEVYSWETYTPLMLLPIMKEARARTTHAWLKNKFSTNSFLILDFESMIHHTINCVPHVSNWLIIGNRWQFCTHSRPLSFQSAIHVPYNFFATTWSMYDPTRPLNSNDFANDKFTWIDHSQGLFQLKNEYASR
jgi:hypothetical protein